MPKSKFVTPIATAEAPHGIHNPPLLYCEPFILDRMRAAILRAHSPREFAERLVAMRVERSRFRAALDKRDLTGAYARVIRSNTMIAVRTWFSLDRTWKPSAPLPALGISARDVYDTEHVLNLPVHSLFEYDHTKRRDFIYRNRLTSRQLAERKKQRLARSAHTEKPLQSTAPQPVPHSFDDDEPAVL